MKFVYILLLLIFFSQLSNCTKINPSLSSASDPPPTPLTHPVTSDSQPSAANIAVEVSNYHTSEQGTAELVSPPTVHTFSTTTQQKSAAILTITREISKLMAAHAVTIADFNAPHLIKAEFNEALSQGSYFYLIDEGSGLFFVTTNSDSLQKFVNSYPNDLLVSSSGTFDLDQNGFLAKVSNNSPYGLTDSSLTNFFAQASKGGFTSSEGSFSLTANVSAIANLEKRVTSKLTHEPRVAPSRPALKTEPLFNPEVKSEPHVGAATRVESSAERKTPRAPVKPESTVVLPIPGTRPPALEVILEAFPEMKNTKQAAGGASGDVYFGSLNGREVVAKRIADPSEIQLMEYLAYWKIGVPVLASSKKKGSQLSAVLMPKASSDAESVVEKAGPQDSYFRQLVAESSACLAGMHQLGYAHNDWKLDNLLLHDGHYKIADLGSAKPINTPNPIGSGDPRFLDPSQFGSPYARPEADVYAQGMSLGYAYLKKFSPPVKLPDLKTLRSGDPQASATFSKDAFDFQNEIRYRLTIAAQWGDHMAAELLSHINPHPDLRPTSATIAKRFSSSLAPAESV